MAPVPQGMHDKLPLLPNLQSYHLLLSRLEKLESTNRLLKWFLLGAWVWVTLLAGVVVWVLAGGKTQFGTVEAREFILKDDDNKPRAGLSVEKNGPGLFLKDENGISRAGLFLGKEGPVLMLLDPDERPRLGLRLDSVGPGVFLVDRDGAMRSILIQDEQGELKLRDRNNKLVPLAPEEKKPGEQGNKLGLPFRR